MATSRCSFAIARAIDLAHAAGAESGDDFVRPDRVASRERHASSDSSGAHCSWLGPPHSEPAQPR